MCPQGFPQIRDCVPALFDGAVDAHPRECLCDHVQRVQSLDVPAITRHIGRGRGPQQQCGRFRATPYQRGARATTVAQDIPREGDGSNGQRIVSATPDSQLLPVQGVQFARAPIDANTHSQGDALLFGSALGQDQCSAVFRFREQRLAEQPRVIVRILDPGENVQVQANTVATHEVLRTVPRPREAQFHPVTVPGAVRNPQFQGCIVLGPDNRHRSAARSRGHFSLGSRRVEQKLAHLLRETCQLNVLVVWAQTRERFNLPLNLGTHLQLLQRRNGLPPALPDKQGHDATQAAVLLAVHDRQQRG
jgi:hypothetical protein